MVSFNLDKLKEQLENLKQLPNIKEVVALSKRLKKEIEKTIPKIKVVVAPTPTVTRGEKISVALKKHFRYLRLIRDNFLEACQCYRDRLDVIFCSCSTVQYQNNSMSGDSFESLRPSLDSK